jgi:hypothetical protein
MLLSMKRMDCLTNLILAILMMGAISLTAVDYVDCKSLDQDEFLDLALASTIPLLPILAFHWKTTPHPLHLQGISHLGVPNLRDMCLRC